MKLNKSLYKIATTDKIKSIIRTRFHQIKPIYKLNLTGKIKD